jgi:hypothetical protein
VLIQYTTWVAVSIRVPLRSKRSSDSSTLLNVP